MNVPPPSEGHSQSAIPQLVLWLCIQLGAISLAILRVPLWAQAPTAQEAFSLQFILIAQIAGGSLLAPWLFITVRSTLLVIITAWPMLALAALVSPAPDGVLLLSGVYVSGWLGMLALFGPPLSPTGSGFLPSAVVSLWSIGGPVALFLHSEYGNSSILPSQWRMAIFGPIVAGSYLASGNLSLAWVVLGISIAVGLTVVLATRLIRFRRFRP